MDESSSLKDAILDRIRRANATLPAKDYPFPLYVIVEPTNVCNLRCVMCPSPKQARPRGVIDPALWRKIIDETARESPESLVWPAIMGEALTAGDLFFDLLDYARGRRVPIVWNTNAVLFTEPWIERAVAAEPREIIIGLDAATEATYDAIRVGGDFRRAVANTCRLLERRHPQTRVTVQFIEQAANAHETETFKRFWLERGAVVKVRPRLGWGNAVETPALILEQNERPGPCPWIMRTISIHWNGIAVQCDGDWDQRWPVGDVNRETVASIWRGELARRRQRHHNRDFDFDPCRECRDWQAGLSTFFFPE